MNMSLANKAYFEAEKETIHLILTGIEDEIYSTVDAFQTVYEMWEAIKRLQQGKEIAKPVTPPSKTAFEEDSDPEQAQRDKDMQKILALIAKYFKKIYKPTNNNLKTSSNSRNKNVDMTLRYKNDNQFGQFRNPRMINVARARGNVGLEAHCSYMAKIQEVPTVDSCTDSEPLEQVQNNTRYNVFSNDLQHSKQSESISNTCLVETDDSNVVPDSPDMCDDDIQNDQNDIESDDERVALANLIANLKLDMAATVQNTNNTIIRSILQQEKLTAPNFMFQKLRIVLASEGKLVHLEQPLAPLPYPILSQATRDAYDSNDMIQELKTMFEEQAKQLLFEIVKAFYACKQEEGQSVSSYLLKIKSCLDTLERLGYAMPKELGGYALETTARILNMVPTKKGCEALVKRDTPDKLDSKSIKCIFVGYPKETMGFYFYYPLKKKIFVSQNAEFFKNSFMGQDVSGSHGLLEMREAAYILGIKIIHDRSKPLISLSQSGYLEKTLKKFRIENFKKGYTLIMENHDYIKSQGAKTTTKTVVKTILKYFRNTKDMVLVYGAKPKDEIKVSCYADASFQTNKDDIKSQMVYVFVLNGGAVDWKSAKQSTTAMSSIEAKYIVIAKASIEAFWIKKFIDGIGDVMPSNKRPMEMLYDNEPALAIANDPKILKGSRHFQRKYHYIHEIAFLDNMPTASLSKAIASVSGGAEAAVPPKTTAKKIARRNELKAKSTLLLAIPNENLLNLEQYTLIMRNKSDLDTLRMDDLYNNLKLYEAKIKGQLRSTLNSQNVAFVSSDNTRITNEAVNTTHNIFVVNLEQIDADDLEEMDLKWQVDMLNIRVKRFIKKIRKNLNFNGKETVSFDKTNVECYNCHRRCHFARECRAPRSLRNRNRDNTKRVVRVETPANALVVSDAIGYDWSYQAEEGPIDFAQLTFSSLGSSGSDTEVNTCSKECVKSYQTLQKQYDQQHEILNKDNLEIIAYQLGLESLEYRIIVHQKNEAVFEEDVAFLKYDVKVRDNSITKLKNNQLSSKDETGLGYDSQLNERDLSNKSDVFESASDSSVNGSKEDNNQANDRYKACEGYHAVPPPYTGNFIPPRPDLSFAGLDDSVFKSAISKIVTSVNETKTCTSKTNPHAHTFLDHNSMHQSCRSCVVGLSAIIMSLILSLKCDSVLQNKVFAVALAVFKPEHLKVDKARKESYKSPTRSLFDVGSNRISIFTVNTYVSLRYSGNTMRIMRRTLDINLAFHSV
uniref:Retroviral polymerase SH3-like domain-containing protein n=1 Tax=Tanacetum cinerariifolium TaxID=118510 RepID=A0A6L2JXM8_TANCI|nr:hypothetical protein [Tanacetum cinerariifolium]